MATIPELMRQNLLGVFNERDPDRRAAVIAATYAEDAVFHDPEGTATGREAIGAKVQAVLDGAPGFVFAPRGPVQESAGELGVLPWRFGPEGGDPVVTGTDIALVRDGLVQTMHTVVEAG